MMILRALYVVMALLFLGMRDGLSEPQADSGGSIAAKGERATMQGEVSGVVRRDNGYIFVNVGCPFPDHRFAVRIHHLDVDEFPEVDSWIGRVVAFSGVVDFYNEKPMIRIRKPADVVIVSKPDAAAN